MSNIISFYPRHLDRRLANQIHTLEQMDSMDRMVEPDAEEIYQTPTIYGHRGMLLGLVVGISLFWIMMWVYVCPVIERVLFSFYDFMRTL